MFNKKGCRLSVDNESYILVEVGEVMQVEANKFPRPFKFCIFRQSFLTNSYLMEAAETSTFFQGKGDLPDGDHQLRLDGLNGQVE